MNLDVDAGFERKKRIKLRQYQRELKNQRKALEIQEREQKTCQYRCQEMAHEDQLSRLMLRLQVRDELQKRREKRREEDMILYEKVVQIRNRAQTLGISLSTPGLAGNERLAELAKRVEEKEKTFDIANQAKKRLDALPKRKSRLRAFMASYFLSSARRKVDHAVFHQHSKELTELLDPQLVGRKAIPELLNHESLNGFTPVLCAIFQHERSALRRLLELGASPDIETRNGLTPLLATILIDDEISMSILMEFHVQIDMETTAGGVIPLILAAEKGRIQLIKTLLRHHANVNQQSLRTGRTALIQSVCSTQYEAATILLAFEADISLHDKEGKTALDWARYFNSSHLVSLLSSNVSSVRLMTQIKKANEELMANSSNSMVVRKLENQKRVLLLENAMKDQNVSRIKELLSGNDIGFGPNHEAPNGDMPLLVVAGVGTAEDILYCLAHKCIPTSCNRKGETALMKAAYWADTSVITLLINAGSALSAMDFSGKDALTRLNEADHPDVVQDLTRRFKKSNDRPYTFVLGSPVMHISTLKQFVEAPHLPRSNLSTITSSLINVEEVIVQTKEENVVDQSDDSDHDSNFEEEEPFFDPIVRSWTIRQRALKKDQNCRNRYDAERMKIMRVAQRPRRNGLIAPLPNDPQGRLKLPPCDQCQGAHRARKRCMLCDQFQCDECHSRLHELPQRRHHPYEEVEPILMVGSVPIPGIKANQQEGIAMALERSVACITAIQEIIIGSGESILEPKRKSFDEETVRFDRARHLEREKDIMQMKIDVPVAASKHAILAGDGEIFTNPAEIELADLYVIHKKYEKARELLYEARRITESSLGFSHPTIFKIDLRIAKIEMLAGDFNKCLESIVMALGTFECQLAPDDKDLLTGQEMLLRALDELARYEEGVSECHRIYRFRVMGLTAGHVITNQILERLDEFIAKREQREMTQNDVLLLTQKAFALEQIEKNQIIAEKQLENFRSMLLGEPDDSLQAYMALAKREFAEDMVRFWIAVEKAKTLNTDAKSFRAASLYNANV